MKNEPKWRPQTTTAPDDQDQRLPNPTFHHLSLHHTRRSWSHQHQPWVGRIPLVVTRSRRGEFITPSASHSPRYPLRRTVSKEISNEFSSPGSASCHTIPAIQQIFFLSIATADWRSTESPGCYVRLTLGSTVLGQVILRLHSSQTSWTWASLPRRPGAVSGVFRSVDNDRQVAKCYQPDDGRWIAKFWGIRELRQVGRYPVCMVGYSCHPQGVYDTYGPIPYPAANAPAYCKAFTFRFLVRRSLKIFKFTRESKLSSILS